MNRNNGARDGGMEARVWSGNDRHRDIRLILAIGGFRVLFFFFIQSPHMGCGEILGETPTMLLSRNTYGILFDGENFRWCHICENEFCRS